jgi:adenylate cyclase
MRIPFRSDLRLKPSILTSFLLLTLPVFATIIAVTYISNERIAREDARDLVERFRVDGIENVQGIFDAIKSLVRASATLGDQQPDFYLSNRSIKYFYSVLLHNEKMVSVYAGLANGEFRQARRIDPNVEIDGKLPPKGPSTPIAGSISRRARARSTTTSSSMRMGRGSVPPSN